MTSLTVLNFLISELGISISNSSSIAQINWINAKDEKLYALSNLVSPAKLTMVNPETSKKIQYVQSNFTLYFL